MFVLLMYREAINPHPTSSRRCSDLKVSCLDRHTPLTSKVTCKVTNLSHSTDRTLTCNAECAHLTSRAGSARNALSDLPCSTLHALHPPTRHAFARSSQVAHRLQLPTERRLNLRTSPRSSHSLNRDHRLLRPQHRECERHCSSSSVMSGPCLYFVLSVTSAPVPSQVKADALARKKMERARRFATGAPAVATTGVKRLPTDDASTDDNNPLTSLVSPPKMIKTTDVEQTKPVSVLMTSVPVDVRAGGDDAIASEYERKLEEQRRMREEVKRKKEERRLMRAHTLKEQPALTSTVTSLLRAPAAEGASVSICRCNLPLRACNKLMFDRSS